MFQISYKQDWARRSTQVRAHTAGATRSAAYAQSNAWASTVYCTPAAMHQMAPPCSICKSPDACSCAPRQQRVPEVVRHRGNDLHQLGRTGQRVLGTRIPPDEGQIHVVPLLYTQHQLLHDLRDGTHACLDEGTAHGEERVAWRYDRRSTLLPPHRRYNPVVPGCSDVHHMRDYV